MKCDHNWFREIRKWLSSFSQLGGIKPHRRVLLNQSATSQGKIWSFNLDFFLIFPAGQNQGKAFSSQAVNLPFAPLITMTENERCDRLLHKKHKNPVDKSAALFILVLSIPASLKPGTHTQGKVVSYMPRGWEGRTSVKSVGKDALHRISLCSRAWFIWSTLWWMLCK